MSTPKYYQNLIPTFLFFSGIINHVALYIGDNIGKEAVGMNIILHMISFDVVTFPTYQA